MFPSLIDLRSTSAHDTFSGRRLAAIADVSIITRVVADLPVMALNAEVALHILQMVVGRLRNVPAAQTAQMVRGHLAKPVHQEVRNLQLK